MRGKSLIVLASAVIALGAFIVLVERHQPTSDERRERADRLFPRLDADRIVAIDVRSGAGAVSLVEEEGEWRLAEPVAYPADPAAVLGLLEAVAGLDADRVLGSDEVDPQSYGLDEPEIGLVLTDDNGRIFELAVGGTAPLGGKRAVRRGDADEVVLCSDGFVSRLDLPVDDWRSREVVAVAEHELSAITIDAGDDRIRAERDGGRWWLVEPLADLADQEQLASLVAELNGLRVSEFLPSEGRTDAADLDHPEFRIRLEGGEGFEAVELELAAPSGDDPTVVCRKNGTDLLRVPDTLRLRLGKAPVLWRSDTVWPFSTWDVTAARFTDPDHDVSLQFVDGLWRVSDGATADGAEVRRRLGRLAELEVEDHDLMLPPTGLLGSVELTMEDDGEEASTVFAFYGAIEEGGHAAVRVSGRDNVMAVDAAIVEAIVGDLEALYLTEDVEAEE
jgi:hypothetical protein